MEGLMGWREEERGWCYSARSLVGIMGPIGLQHMLGDEGVLEVLLWMIMNFVTFLNDISPR